MKESIELLKTLTDVNGIAGYEYQVKEKMRNYLHLLVMRLSKMVWVVSSVKRKVKRDLNH